MENEMNTECGKLEYRTGLSQTLINCSGSSSDDSGGPSSSSSPVPACPAACISPPLVASFSQQQSKANFSPSNVDVMFTPGLAALQINAQKAATLPCMGPTSASAGLPNPYQNFLREDYRQGYCLSSPNIQNLMETLTMNDGMRCSLDSTCPTLAGGGSPSNTLDVLSAGVWANTDDYKANTTQPSTSSAASLISVSNDIAAQQQQQQSFAREQPLLYAAISSDAPCHFEQDSPANSCLSAPSLTRNISACSTQNSQNFPVPLAALAAQNSSLIQTPIVGNESTVNAFPLFVSRRPTEGSSPNMVLSQHPPPSKNPYYAGSQYQKAFAGAYKGVQNVIATPPPTRYQHASAFNSLNVNGLNCIENGQVKSSRSQYQIETRNGMRDVHTWLKSLRLHKYTAMFQQMGYDEMMALDERKLEALNVTKGARKKIMQSIQKLRERVPTLKQLEKSIEGRGGDIGCVIAELRGTMNTPIRSFPPPGATLRDECTQNRIDGIGIPADDLDDENLPGHIIRILGKVHNSVMESRDSIVPLLEDEYYGWLMQTYERIANHEAFTQAQKQRVASWKRAMRKICSPSMGRKGTRLPHASVLLASGAQSSMSPQTSQCSPCSSVSSAVGGTQGMQNCQPPAVVSQSAIQNAFAVIINALHSRAIDSQTAAYYLGVASVAASLIPPSPEQIQQMREVLNQLNRGSVGSPQFQQPFNLQLLANLLVQVVHQQSTTMAPSGGIPVPPSTNQSSFTQPKPATTVNGLSAKLEQPPSSGAVSIQQPNSNAWKSFPSAEQQIVGAVDHISTHYNQMKDTMLSSQMLDSSALSCLTPSTSSLAQPQCVVSQASRDGYSECRQPLSNASSVNLPSAVAPSAKQAQQRLLQSAFGRDAVAMSSANSCSGHRRSSSNVSVPSNPLCSAWNNSENNAVPMINSSLFEPISIPARVNVSATQTAAQPRRMSTQESSLFGAALPPCAASSVSPSARLGSGSSSSGYSSSASDRSSGAGSPPGLMVYNFASEHPSGELDNMCRSVAALNFEYTSQERRLQNRTSVLQ